MPFLFRASLALSLGLIALWPLQGQDVPPPLPPPETNVSYKTGDNLSDYEKERCKLDIYLPPGAPKGFPTFVWLHGGNIISGSKEGMANLASVFTKQGIAFVAINYRLSPKVSYPAYLEDTAAAFAWVYQHIAERGGDPRKVFLGGHSAGAYLTSLVGMDVRYLKQFGLEGDAIAGLLPVSGQMMTHFTVRKEKGLGPNTVTADEAAPIFYTRKDTPPFLIIMGDHDWPARWEENLYFAAVMKVAGNDRVTTIQIPDRTHASIAGRIPEPGDPAGQAMVDFIKKISVERETGK